MQLIVFCAAIGMALAVPGLPSWRRALRMLVAVRRHLAGGGRRRRLQLPGRGTASTRKMKRTAWRPTAKGELSRHADLLFSALLCGAGGPAGRGVNPLTMWLTFATFVGYAVIYTVVLKPLTPQNIVIGGASGAMPPVLGWAAMTGGELGPRPWMLFLIIFVWTPPHFWALALYRVEDYAKAGLPMLPVTHGNEFTRLQICSTPSCCWRHAAAPAFGIRHEQLALPGRRWCWAASSAPMAGSCGATTRCAGATHLLFFDLVPGPAVRGAARDHYLQ